MSRNFSFVDTVELTFQKFFRHVQQHKLIIRELLYRLVFLVALQLREMVMYSGHKNYAIEQHLTFYFGTLFEANLIDIEIQIIKA